MDIKSILIYALYYFYNVLTFAIFIRCILSWFPIGRDNIFVKILDAVTEPILAPIRNIVNKSPIGGFMVDFSPIIALLIVQIIYRILIGIVAAL